MKYLITGGAGFIGSTLANYLAKKGHEITIVDDLSMGTKKNVKSGQINFIEGDVCDKKLIESILKNTQFDYVFLFAAIASVADSVERPLQTHKVNFQSVLEFLEAARKYQKKLKRIVFASSAAVFGDEETLPKYEESVIRPLTPYAIDKFSAEKYVLAYNNLYQLPTSAVRFFNVYGMNQNPNSVYSGVLSIITENFKKLLANEEATFNMYGDGTQSRDFIFIEDVIQALILVAENEESKGQVYNVGTGINTSLNQIIEIFEDISCKELFVQYLNPRTGDINKSYADISKLKKIGFNPNYNVQEGIKKYFEYEIKNSSSYN